MADVKFQVYRGNTPADHVDFRGDGFRGSPDDEHRTIAEVTNASDDLVEVVLSMGPEVNSLLETIVSAQPDALGHLATALGLDGSGDVKLAVRVYDE